MVDLPLVVVPHPVGTISLDQVRSLAESTVDSITANLLRQREPAPESAGLAQEKIAPLESMVRVSKEPAALFTELVKRGWSDGLPVLPPTRAAVNEMIAASGLGKDFVLGVMPPLNGVATIEKIAANAVMAGCLPEYFPLVIAAVKCVLKPGFNIDGVQTTTGNVAPVIIVNGPCRKGVEINCGANVLGQGWRANATIGRTLRLVMTNVGGATPGLFDKSTVGQPAKYTFCFGENEEESPWEPLHVERGLGAAASAVNVTGCSGVYSAVDMASQTAKGLLKTFALTMTGGLASGVTSTEVMFVICPEHAAIFAAGGFSKDAIRQELFVMARVPHENISEENLELLSKRRPVWFEHGVAREVGAVDCPEDIWIVVAGGAGAKSAYIPGRTGTRMQTVAVGGRIGVVE
jgi:hypothetical protein